MQEGMGNGKSYTEPNGALGSEHNAAAGGAVFGEQTRSALLLCPSTARMVATRGHQGCSEVANAQWPHLAPTGRTTH